jgi:hypothetical protein
VWLQADTRIENGGETNVVWIDAGIVCADDAESGGWRADSTFNLNAGVAAGTFDEGSVNLFLPGASLFKEDRSVCAEPASIVVRTTGPVETRNAAVISLPSKIVAQLNDFRAVPDSARFSCERDGHRIGQRVQKTSRATLPHFGRVALLVFRCVSRTGFEPVPPP